MTFDAIHALRFVNRGRPAMALPALDELPCAGALLADERHCVLTRALRGEIAGSDDHGWITAAGAGYVANGQLCFETWSCDSFPAATVERPTRLLARCGPPDRSQAFLVSDR